MPEWKSMISIELYALSSPLAGTIPKVAANSAESWSHPDIPLGKAHLDPERIGKAAELASTGVAPAAYVEEALRWLPVRWREAGLWSDRISLPRH
jgi:hypothetical protein